MLAFALSIDDFVISNFNSGTTVTFPLYIFGATLRGIPVQVNVLATMLFAVDRRRRSPSSPGSSAGPKRMAAVRPGAGVRPDPTPGTAAAQ